MCLSSAMLDRRLFAGLLHWFIGPYVHKLWHHAPSQQVKVELRSLFLQPMCAPSVLSLPNLFLGDASAEVSMDVSVQPGDFP
jgi:hypothetical protein